MEVAINIDEGKPTCPLLLAYVDEVKPNKDFNFYMLGAVIADANIVRNLESKLNALAEKTFGSQLLTKRTEFHASHIWNGKAHFKDWDHPRRISLLKDLIEIFGNASMQIEKVLITIDIDKIKYPNVNHEEKALMFLIEKIDAYLGVIKTPGMLIIDRENEELAGKNAESLSRYRKSGTDLHFGRPINNLLDTAHFTHSHHSRMIQLADLHTWIHQFIKLGDRGTPHRKQIIDHVKSFNDCLKLKKYRDWPTDHSWHS